jgi:hypothetical protein
MVDACTVYIENVKMMLLYKIPENILFAAPLDSVCKNGHYNFVKLSFLCSVWVFGERGPLWPGLTIFSGTCAIHCKFGSRHYQI